MSSYVERLEARFDASANEPWPDDTDVVEADLEDGDDDWFDEEDLPSGESLAEDFERYLRDQGDD